MGREIELKMAEINKKYKCELVQLGTDIIEVDKIPFSSPMANYMTYGGIPVGKITEYFGGEGGGKTTSALDTCANAQMKFQDVYDKKVAQLQQEIQELQAKDTKEANKQVQKKQKELDEVIEKGCKVVLYVDTEQTLDTKWAQLLGVDTEAMYLVRPQQQTAEQILQMIIDLVATGDVGLVVLDSIPCLVPQQIYDESLEKKAYGGVSQPLSVFSTKIIPYLVQNQCAFIAINQIRDDLGSMFNTIKTPGGRAWKHACSLRIKFKKDTFLDMDNKELSSKAECPAGNRVGMEIVKTKVCRPDRKLGYYTLNYTHGIDAIYDLVNVAISYNIVEKAGAWYRIKDNEGKILVDDEGNEVNYQGMSNLINYIEDNVGVYTYINNKVNEAILHE